MTQEPQELAECQGWHEIEAYLVRRTLRALRMAETAHARTLTPQRGVSVKELIETQLGAERQAATYASAAAAVHAYREYYPPPTTE